MEDFTADFLDSGLWRRHEGVRVAGWAEEGTPHLFADGELVQASLDGDQVKLIAGSRELEFDEVSEDPEVMKTLYEFTRRGWGYLVAGDDE